MYLLTTFCKIRKIKNIKTFLNNFFFQCGMIVFDKFRVVEKLKVEFVERKGLGHPDSLADGIAEQLSRSLAKTYIEKTGKVLHYNVDKLELVAGSSNPRFGGGELLKPVFILFSGRATKFFNKQFINLEEIAFNTAKDYLGKVLPLLKQEFLEMESKIGQGSVDLTKLFSIKAKAPLANDTSFGVGFWPLTPLENAVLSIEKFVQSLRGEEKFIGPDVKVMGVRQGKKVFLTLAIAFIDKHVASLKEYLSLKQELQSRLLEHAKTLLQGFKTQVFINTGDKPGKGEVYLTVTGSSVEAGDDGAVGRGNRVNGLITPCREMSLEAAAGKNAVSHVGKIYNIAALQLSKQIFNATGKQVGVKLVSQIGKPITKPLTVVVSMFKPEKQDRLRAKQIVKEFLNNELLKINDALLRQEITVF